MVCDDAEEAAGRRVLHNAIAGNAEGGGAQASHYGRPRPRYNLRVNNVQLYSPTSAADAPEACI